jgi:creatinine amidohydrolase
MRPGQVDAAMKACPVLYQPLGTIEWHGLHNWVGLDAVKARALCVRAAERGGGLVAPALYGGIGGLDEPHTFVMEPEHALHSVQLRPWLEKLCFEAVRNGFKAVILLTGHYGAGQQICVRETAVRMTKILDRPVLGTPEYFLALDEEYYGDHAAFFETSLMMHLFPESVDLGELGEAPHQGVGGRDPKEHATAEDGKRMAEAIIARLSALAGQMPGWDAETVQAFNRGEEALVNRQLQLASPGEAWSAWRHIGDGVFNAYPDLLVNRRFDAIVELVERL